MEPGPGLHRTHHSSVPWTTGSLYLTRFVLQLLRSSLISSGILVWDHFTVWIPPPPPPPPPPPHTHTFYSKCKVHIFVTDQHEGYIAADCLLRIHKHNLPVQWDACVTTEGPYVPGILNSPRECAGLKKWNVCLCLIAVHMMYHWPFLFLQSSKALHKKTNILFQKSFPGAVDWPGH